MSRMFHRVLATSVIGAAALAAPVTAMAADSGGGGGSGAEPTPTAIVVHLPRHVEAGEPVTVTARVTPRAAEESSGEQTGKGQDKPSQGDDQQGEQGTGKGGRGAGGGHRHHKGVGHGKKKGKHHKGLGKGRRHAVTGEVEFVLDGKPEPSVAVSRGRASEKIEIPLGRHTIVAEYSGDEDFLAAKSDPVTFELTAGQDDQSAQSGDQDGDGGYGPGGGEVAGQDPDYPTLGQDQDEPTIDQDQGDSTFGQDQGDSTIGQGQDDRRQDD